MTAVSSRRVRSIPSDQGGSEGATWWTKEPPPFVPTQITGVIPTPVGHVVGVTDPVVWAAGWSGAAEVPQAANDAVTATATNHLPGPPLICALPVEATRLGRFGRAGPAPHPDRVRSVTVDGDGVRRVAIPGPAIEFPAPSRRRPVRPLAGRGG